MDNDSTYVCKIQSSFLECSICLDFWINNDPRILPCQHIFCYECLIQIDIRDKLVCPNCRYCVYLDSINELPKPLIASNLVRRQSSIKKKKQLEEQSNVTEKPQNIDFCSEFLRSVNLENISDTDDEFDPAYYEEFLRTELRLDTEEADEVAAEQIPGERQEVRSYNMNGIILALDSDEASSYESYEEENSHQNIQMPIHGLRMNHATEEEEDDTSFDSFELFETGVEYEGDDEEDEEEEEEEEDEENEEDEEDEEDEEEGKNETEIDKQEPKLIKLFRHLLFKKSNKPKRRKRFLKLFKIFKKKKEPKSTLSIREQFGSLSLIPLVPVLNVSAN